eukprot:GHVP01036036.1.p1 GENE.GHVP01036036.1~~GHVP01036036.1.p1  ORF type:complete len:152 (+),score=14.93 GHVP01036036.1:140-595(+)
MRFLFSTLTIALVLNVRKSEIEMTEKLTAKDFIDGNIEGLPIGDDALDLDWGVLPKIEITECPVASEDYGSKPAWADDDAELYEEANEILEDILPRAKWTKAVYRALKFAVDVHAYVTTGATILNCLKVSYGFQKHELFGARNGGFERRLD